MLIHVACVVEGHGEVQAAPILLRRIAQLTDPTLAVHTPTPIRVPRDRVIKPGELERSLELASRKLAGPGGVLVLLDSEGECPAHLGPTLRERAITVLRDRPVAVVLANQEFEAWFLAAAESLRGLCELPQDLAAPLDPEAIHGAKEWLRRQMPRGRTYRETLHQPALAARFDLRAALTAPSFDKLYREVGRMLKLLSEPGEASASAN